MSLQVGLPRTLTSPTGKTFQSGIVKEPVNDPLFLSKNGLPGDRQAAKIVHGGPHKAVLVYPACHYEAWREELALPQLGPGGFGENFTVTSMDEASVCIGDVFSVGDALVQISQPRDPCWKLGARWQRMTLPERVETTGRTGWYLRVLKEGEVQAGQEIVLQERPRPEWTVAFCREIKAHTRTHAREALTLSTLPELSPLWRMGMLKRLMTVGA